MFTKWNQGILTKHLHVESWELTLSQLGFLSPTCAAVKDRSDAAATVQIQNSEKHTQSKVNVSIVYL